MAAICRSCGDAVGTAHNCPGFYRPPSTSAAVNPLEAVTLPASIPPGSVLSQKTFYTLPGASQPEGTFFPFPAVFAPAPADPNLLRMLERIALAAEKLVRELAQE